MYMINSYSVDQALHDGMLLLHHHGIREQTRNGDTIVMPSPVMTVNHRPMNRVSFSPLRDANPFFHLMEALWMLAGRNDIRWLDQFVQDFSKRFGEETPQGTYMHGAYGYRWRQHFDMDGGGLPWAPDQLKKIIELLKANPFDRRVVLTMWDPLADLGANVKDVPCNTHIYPRVRETRKKQAVYLDQGDMSDILERELDLTVCCRSNDAVLGAHGANAVHFSVLQEYIAAHIGVGVGKLYQMSNNYHGYMTEVNKIWPSIKNETHGDYNRLPPTRIVTDAGKFDDDLNFFMSENYHLMVYHNDFFDQVAIPMRRAYALWRDKERDAARELVRRIPTCDWAVAAQEWFQRKWAMAHGLKAEG